MELNITNLTSDIRTSGVISALEKDKGSISIDFVEQMC